MGIETEIVLSQNLNSKHIHHILQIFLPMIVAVGLYKFIIGSHGRNYTIPFIDDVSRIPPWNVMTFLTFLIFLWLRMFVRVKKMCC